MAEVGEGDTTPSDGSNGSGHRPPLTKEARELLEGLDTGDLVLFDRPCLKMGGVFGAVICAAAKVVGGSPFDHIGVVVKDENGSNAMIEASFSGVAVRPLCERIRRSSASQICVRRLQAHRTEEMRDEARRFVSEVAHLPYKEGGEGLLQMASAAFRFHPAKEQRRRVHAETVALSTTIASLERELVVQLEAGDPAQDAILVKECLRRAVTRRRRALGLLEAPSDGPTTTPTASAAAAAAAAATPPASGAPASTPTVTPSGNNKHSSGLPSAGTWTPLDPVPPRPSAAHTSPPSPPSSSSSSSSTTTPLPELPPPPTPYHGGLFCSELVAALYQRIGILDAPFPARHDYVPADFAQSLGNPVGCVGVVDGCGEGTGGGGTAVAANKVAAPGTEDEEKEEHCTATATNKEKARRQSDDRKTNEACAEEAFLVLPPPIPEGGGRVALLRGAALGPGRWLRGGPPPRSASTSSSTSSSSSSSLSSSSSSSLDNEEEDEERNGKGDRAGRGSSSSSSSSGRRGSSPSATAAPTETSASSGSGSPRPSQRDVVVVVAAAAVDVLGFGFGTRKGEGRRALVGGVTMTMAEPRLRQQQQQQHQQGRNVGNMRWALTTVAEASSLSDITVARCRTTPFSPCWHGVVWRDHPGCDGLSRRLAVPATRKTVVEGVDHGDRKPSSLPPIAVGTVAAAAAAAFVGSKTLNPVIFGRGRRLGGGTTMMLGACTAACLTAGACGVVISPGKRHSSCL